MLNTNLTDSSRGPTWARAPLNHPKWPSEWREDASETREPIQTANLEQLHRVLRRRVVTW